MRAPVRLSLLKYATATFALAFAGVALGAPPDDAGAPGRTPVVARPRARLTPEQKKRFAEAVVPALAKTRDKIKGVVRDARGHRLEVRTPSLPDVENATELADGRFAFVLQFEHGLGAEGFFAIVEDAEAGAKLVASEPWPGGGMPRGGVREARLGDDRVLFETDHGEGAGSADTTRVWLARDDKLVLLGQVDTAATVLDVRDPTGAGRMLIASMDATLETDGDAIVAREKWTLYDVGDPSGQKRLRTAQRVVTYVRKGDKLRRTSAAKPPFG